MEVVTHFRWSGSQDPHPRPIHTYSSAIFKLQQKVFFKSITGYIFFLSNINELQILIFINAEHFLKIPFLVKKKQNYRNKQKNIFLNTNISIVKALTKRATEASFSHLSCFNMHVIRK